MGRVVCGRVWWRVFRKLIWFVCECFLIRIEIVVVLEIRLFVFSKFYLLGFVKVFGGEKGVCFCRVFCCVVMVRK